MKMTAWARLNTQVVVLKSSSIASYGGPYALYHTAIADHHRTSMS